MNVELRTPDRRRLTWRLSTCLCAVMALALFSVALDLRAQPANSNSFNIILRRNIFDPNRPRIRPQDHHSTPPTPDIFALVGTMSYSKGKFAFFDGTRSDYKKVLEPGATIGGYTIKDVTPKDVTLAANGKEVTLTVGSQMTQ